MGSLEKVGGELTSLPTYWNILQNFGIKTGFIGTQMERQANEPE